MGNLVLGYLHTQQVGSQGVGGGRGQPGAFRVCRRRAAQGVSCRDVREVHARLPGRVRLEAAWRWCLRCWTWALQ